MKNKKLLLLIFGIVVNFSGYSQWADITSTIGGGITSTTNMAKPYVFDLNNDNYPDFLVPMLTNVVSPYTRYWKLFKNNGNSTFTDVTTSFGLPTNLTSTLGFIDYNGDGFKDLYFYTDTGLQILKNNNGTSFTDVSTQLGIASSFFVSGEINSYPLKVFDYDLDGDEDLLYTRTVSGSNTLTAIVNNGASFSTKVNILTSIPGGPAGINFSFFDMDNDGDFDIVFDGFTTTSQYSNGITTLYKKDATGYINTTSSSGLVNGLPGEISTIDINQDGNLDIVKAGADCCTSPLYRVFIGNGTGVFTEQTSSYAISNGAYKYSPTIVDFDNDGDFDFSWSSYASTSLTLFQLYANSNNVFTETASTYGLNLGIGIEHANGVWMDLDKDGDLDIVVNREGQVSTSTTGNVWVKRNPIQGNYINIKLNGCGVNKSGIGAKIKLVVGTNTKWLYYEKSTDGNASNGTDIFHFGLGSATLINSITVYWPNNTTTVLNNVTGNQFLTIGGGAGGSSAPTGSASQTLCSGSTVADLTATGANIKWYSASTGGTVLASTTTLVNGITYYASQTVDSCESSSRTAITVSLNDPQITASATNICSGNSVSITITPSLLNRNTIIINPGNRIQGIRGSVFEYDFNASSPNWQTETGLWSTGYLPFIGVDIGALENSTYWPIGTTCYIRKQIDLSNIDLSSLNWNIAVDNGYVLYINGTPISSEYEGGPAIEWEYTGIIPSNLLISGLNNFALTLSDDGTASGFNFLVTGQYNLPTYLWSTGETTSIINPSLATTTEYWVDVTTNGVTCRKFITITVNSTPVPSGANIQTASQGSTLANLLVTGQDIQWYANSFEGTPLTLNTPLVNGTTYYASQTINGCESQDRLPVTVQFTLNNNEFDSINIVYNPNPVIDILYIKASTELKNAKICNVLGQTIFQQRFNSNEIQLNMSDFSIGTYFVIVESDDRKETFKILKK